MGGQHVPAEDRACVPGAPHQCRVRGRRGDPGGHLWVRAGDLGFAGPRCELLMSCVGHLQAPARLGCLLLSLGLGTPANHKSLGSHLWRGKTLASVGGQRCVERLMVAELWPGPWGGGGGGGAGATGLVHFLSLGDPAGWAEGLAEHIEIGRDILPSPSPVPADEPENRASIFFFFFSPPITYRSIALTQWQALF